MAYLGHLLGRLGTALPHLGLVFSHLGPVLAHLLALGRLGPGGDFAFLAIFGTQNGAHNWHVFDIIPAPILILFISSSKNDLY